MRASERVAVVFVVVLMLLPALLAFPALGLWYVARAWPLLEPSQRALFLLSLVTLCGTLVYVFRDKLDLFAYGRTKEFSLIEQALIFGPIVVGEWAVTRTCMVLFVVVLAKLTVWMVRVEERLNGKVDVVDVSKLTEPEHVEISLLARARQLFRRRQSAIWYGSVITTGRRAKPKRYRRRR